MLKINLADKILNKSNSYAFYRNKYVELIKNNKLLKKKVKKLKKSHEIENNKYNIELNYLNSQIDKLKKNHQDLLLYSNDFNHEILLYTKENFYANLFKDTICQSDWLLNKNFSLHYGAANYSFLYLLYRILDEFKPRNILELGLGQSTKLTTQYINNSGHDKNLVVIDDDEKWINNFSKKLSLNDNIFIKNAELEKFVFQSSKNFKYKNIKNIINKKKFDLVIIDGPVGMNQEYPRSNILEIINNLKEDFIVIMDDHDRTGEKNTINEFIKILNQKNIKNYHLRIFGIKEQIAIGTERYKSLKWF